MGGLAGLVDVVHCVAQSAWLQCRSTPTFCVSRFGLGIHVLVVFPCTVLLLFWLVELVGWGGQGGVVVVV